MRSIIAALLLFSSISEAAQHCASTTPGVHATGSMAILPTTAPIAFSRATAQTQLPGPLWGTLKPPLPTNAWWENLVLAAGDQPVAPYPYLVSALGNGLAVSYQPTPVATATSVTYAFVQDLVLGFGGSLTASRELAAFDPLTATMRWTVSKASSMDAILVRGQPYQTVVYRSLAPVVSTVHTILRIDGIAAVAGATITGKRFVLDLNSGATWTVYASSAVMLTLVGVSELVAAAPFSGVLRAAVVTSAAAQTALDAYAGTYGTSGAVSHTVTGNTAVVRFQCATKPISASTKSTGFLSCLLPHHVDAGATGKVVLKDGFQSPRGPMTCIAAAVLETTAHFWQVHEPLTTISWDAPRAIDADKAAAVRAALVADQGKTPTDTDPYFFGKEVAAMGRLALIADALNETAVAATVRGNMQAVLAPWLGDTNADKLLYDPSWGGVCSSAGLANGGADFGNGLYNDHHFHYGYFMYAAAALGRHDAAWLTANADALDELVRDFANPDAGDRFFPFARMFDWYEGHSWAAGITPFGAGKNQESTSEAVNAYYGLYLLGKARGSADLADWGRVLLSMEIRSAQRYWHITAAAAPQIYPQPFAANKVVGVLWNSLASYATWFGSNVEFIHGIQMLPFTPISETLLSEAWVTEEYPVLAPAAATAAQGWLGFVYMDHAIIDKAAAWAEVQTLTAFDNGNTLTNTMYWVATRP